MKNRIAALAAAVVMLQSGCGAGEDVSPRQAEGKQEELSGTPVTFWTYCATPERDADFKKFGETIHQEYPDLRLDYLGVSGDIQVFSQKLDVAIAAGTAPDFTDYYDTKYIRSGFYEPLDSYFDTWVVRDKIDVNAVEMVRRCDPGNGRLYAIPFATQPWGMWVRTDLLRERGLGVPQTWEELFSDVEILTDKSQDRFGIAIRGGPGSANTLEMLMYSYSGIANYYDKNGRSTINDPKNVEFVERYLGLYNRFTAQDDIAKGWTQLTAAFEAGKAAIIFHNFGSGTSMDAAFSKDISKYEAAALPVGKDGRRLQFSMPRCVAMNSASKLKDQVFTAISVYCSPEVQVPRCKTQGEVPTHIDGVTAPAYIDIGRPYIQLAASIASGEGEFIQNPLYLPNYTKIQETVGVMIQKVMIGEMSAQEMLDKWALLMEKAQSDFEKGAKP